MSSGLRILVPVKRVIDYAVRPRVNRAQTGVETAGVKHSMNPFDELAVEEAVRLRERAAVPVAEIVAVSAGPAKAADVLRTALAMGADRGLHVVVEDGNGEAGSGGGGGGGGSSSSQLEPLAVAKLLRAVVERERADLVVLGKQSIDDDAAQTGQMLAGLLGWAQATQAAKVEIGPAAAETDAPHSSSSSSPASAAAPAPAPAAYIAKVTREVDGGVETVRARLPLVITTDLRLNQPRYATLPNIMRAKKKPLARTTPAELGVDVAPRLRTLKVAEPEPRKPGVKVDSVDEFVSKLKELGAL